MMLPDKLPERGRFRALYAWLNQLRGFTQSLVPALSQGVMTSFTGAGVLREAIPPAAGTEGEIAFKGEWIDQAYAKGDIVTRGAVAALGHPIDTTLQAIGAPGTYIALKTVPSGTDAPEQPNSGDYWQTLARFATHILYVAKSGQGSVLMNAASCKKPDGTYVALTIQEIPICIVEGGVKKQKYFMGLRSAYYEH